MLRQSATENKSKVPDTITDSDGRVYHKSDFENPAMPGFTLPGRLFSSFELVCCGKWGLVAPSGFHFAAHVPLQLPADATRISASEAPAGLRQAVADAEQRLAAAAAVVSAALEARTVAEEEQLAGARAQNAKKYNAAIVAAQEAEQRRLDAELALPQLRVALSHATERLKYWMDDESLIRSGAAERPAEPAIF